MSTSDHPSKPPAPDTNSIALDARLLLPATTGWLAAVVLVAQKPWVGCLAATIAGLLAIAVMGLHRRWRGVWAVAGALVVVAGLSVASALQVQSLRAGPVSRLAANSESAKIRIHLSSDPLLRASTSTRRPPYVVVHATIEEVRANGTTTSVRTPVLVVAPAGWRTVRFGQRVETTGRFEQVEPGSSVAAMVSVRGRPRVVAEPAWWLRAAEHVRAGLRESVAPEPPAVRGLVPALVMGDESALPTELVEDFQTTGMTHLSAVSGTNLTLLLAFVLPMARLAGVRARWLTVLGVVTVVVFIVLARPQPSVLRAAVMGLVALTAITGYGAGRRAVRSLSVAVLTLLLIDTSLARSAGFALSVLATAGIVLLAPAWRDGLSRWLPDRLAEAIACPLAAQLACTPVVAWLSGEISLVAVAANLLAGPAVGPATVLGFGAAAIAVVSDDLARLGGWGAGWPARWIILVAETGAGLPGASSPWPATVLGITVLTAGCLILALGLHRLLVRPLTMIVTFVLLIVVLVRPVRTIGWPPPDWLMVACDVGQGDGLVIRTGAGSGIVVDTGPDPGPIDSCLRDLGITTVPVVILSHFHADHAGGLAGVLHNRSTGEVLVTPYYSPPAEYRRVSRLAQHHGIQVRPITYRETHTAGPVTWTTLWPARVPAPDAATPSPENNASITVMLTSGGLRFLLTGDLEPESQRALLATGADLRADVLKVPHHGSARQDPTFLAATQARLALISAGRDNDYGHPAPRTLTLLARQGTRPLRTDTAGPIAVSNANDRLTYTTPTSAR